MRTCLLVLALAVSLCTALPAAAQSRDASGDPAASDLQREDAVAAELSALAAARADWPALFEAAYARYPAVPRGLLESIAFVQSRWTMLECI